MTRDVPQLIDLDHVSRWRELKSTANCLKFTLTAGAADHSRFLPASFWARTEQPINSVAR